MNLWILTEEKPKISTMLEILRLYSRDYSSNVIFDETSVKIKPLFSNGVFTFSYMLENITVSGINNVIIKTVSGSTSFLDFLVFKQSTEPVDGCMKSLIMAIEETKTSDDESRNTGVYQRGSKFVLIRYYDKNVKLYMLYNNELGERENKIPSETSIFGTNILMTLGVDIAGKSMNSRFSAFHTVDDVIAFKSSMRKPPAGNVPIDIIKDGNTIYISGRLSKPSDAGNIGHDPNIGALSMISACLRHLGWDGNIVITKHGVSQEYASRNQSNKFFHIANFLDISLDGLTCNRQAAFPAIYWYYEISSEKVASILLHVTAEYYDMREIYQNHAGCERGYFKPGNGQLIALPKKAADGINNLNIPDLVIGTANYGLVLLVEGKRLDTLQQGIDELITYDSIENEYIRKHFSNATIERWICIFGGNNAGIPHEKVLLYLNQSGGIFINEDSPSCIIEAFWKLMK